MGLAGVIFWTGLVLFFMNFFINPEKLV